MVIRIATKTKMPGKPKAARGKVTRKEKRKRIFERRPKLKGVEEGTKKLNMSPGAMGGRTKAKFTPRTTKMPGGLRRITENMRRQKLGRATKSTIKGAGATGAGMAGQAMKLAKKLKTSGRLSVDDLMRAKKMMMGRKGK
jgi:hypothetical protein